MTQPRSRREDNTALQEAERRIQEVHRTGARELDLAALGLTVLPASLGQLAQLQALDVSENRLTVLPEALGQLTQLQSLAVTKNELVALPESFGSLTQLQFLDVSDNQLLTLPEALGQLTHLQLLFVPQNRLQALPESLGRLTLLQSLEAWRNALVALPESLGQLGQLRCLDVSENRLTALPESLGQLTKLQDLNLARNALVALPESLGQLGQLRRLDVTQNRLTALPQSLSQLQSLTELYIHGNKALGLPSDVLGRAAHEVVLQGGAPARPADILNYYMRLRSGGRPLNEARLIVIGHGAVGKTSLVNRLVYDRFDRDEQKTAGIQITQWPLRLHDAEDVRLHVWDFGGQEIMHATHQFFLTKRSLYLLVLNGRQGHEDADADYWLRLIESFAEDSPVIVVLNKIREYPFDLNRRGLLQKFAAIRDFIETDCKDRTGLDTLLQAIARETDCLEHLRDAFPVSWFTIKDRLASMAENYVTFDRYREVCAGLGETDPQMQNSLALYLHYLGIALNYKDDARLRDTHVLNPHWITNGVYAILNAERLARQHGELYITDLPHILDTTAYPPERYSFLLELMQKFDLCFRFPEDDGHYLLPELLDKQQPVEAEAFTPAECLNFAYHYAILPGGLLPRFIVRTHVLSIGQPCWRSGVILQFEGNRALVKADAPDKKVLINITGPAAGRRRLLAIIRSDFEHLHRAFTLRPQEMIPVPAHPDIAVPYQELLVMEQNGLQTLPKVVENAVLTLDVQALLNGVDLEGTRPRPRASNALGQTLRLFYSYAHKDEPLRDELEIHLKILQRRGLIESWYDRKIDAGDDWKRQIDTHLERADIFLLLLSPDFIASDYCWNIEMQRALERHKAGEAQVIPIIVRDVQWQEALPLTVQALPKDGKAITTWLDRDTAWRNVSEGIEQVVHRLRHKRMHP